MRQGKGLVTVHFDVPCERLKEISAMVKILGGVEREQKTKDGAVNLNDRIPWREVLPTAHPGRALRALRRRENISQKELAKKIGTQQPNISAIEKEEREIGKTLAIKIGRIFKTDYKIFL